MTNNKFINVLSLYDGISCGYQALKEAGVNVGNYYASEVDKYAMSVAKANHPNISAGRIICNSINNINNLNYKKYVGSILSKQNPSY